MEQLPTPEVKQTVSIKEALRQQLEDEWTRADQELKTTVATLEAARDTAAARLEIFDHTIGVPALVVTIETWTTDYDVWTSGEQPGSRVATNYQVHSDDFDSVFDAVEALIEQDEFLLYKLKNHDLSLTQISTLLMNGDALALNHEIYEATWKQRVARLTRLMIE
jgi:hypothetical protein